LVFFRGNTGHDIGLGAILGAPFMLATLGFFVTAAAAYAYRNRRSSGARLALNRAVASRDLGFFLPLYAAAIGASFMPVGHWTRVVVSVGLILGYFYYIYLNLRESAEGEKKEPLTFNLVWAYIPLVWRNQEVHVERRGRIEDYTPSLRACGGQIAVALALILGGAFQFVHATEALTALVGISPLVFALIIAPIATELPEKFNSIIWVRQGRDTLSLGNISGAMVFQSTFPVSIGMWLTDWSFRGLEAGGAAILSALIALVSAALALGAIRCCKSATVSAAPFALGLVWWLLFLGYVVGHHVAHIF
jgi:cation:H+ antiporter